MSISSAANINTNLKFYANALSNSMFLADYQNLLRGLKVMYDGAKPWEREALKARMLDIAWKIKSLNVA